MKKNFMDYKGTTSLWLDLSIPATTSSRTVYIHATIYAYACLYVCTHKYIYVYIYPVCGRAYAGGYRCRGTMMERGCSLSVLQVYIHQTIKEPRHCCRGGSLGKVPLVASGLFFKAWCNLTRSRALSSTHFVVYPSSKCFLLCKYTYISQYVSNKTLVLYCM